MSRGATLDLCLFGAPTDTGNLGVSALGESVVEGLLATDQVCSLTVFDHGWGVRHDPEGAVRRIGARTSRRLHRPESWTRMRLEARLGRRGNPGLDAMRDSEAILDLSGGDSFTDLYGAKRFRSVMAPKRMALALGRPLILLPQTYGPFCGARARAEATEVLRRATAVWARDSDSAAVVADLLGPAHDPARHRTGVDVAFALPPRPLPSALAEQMTSWADAGTVVGVNVSGLLYNDPGSAARFGLSAEYRVAMHDLVSRLAATGARVVLVPHVRTPDGTGECDLTASRAVRAAVGRPEVEVVEDRLVAGQVKALIAGFDWFCGTRMHATIAALSSQVPVAAVAYSAKTAGVFATCGLATAVVDARSQPTRRLVEDLLSAFSDRAATRRTLTASIPPVVGAAHAQLASIVADLGSHAPQGASS